MVHDGMQKSRVVSWQDPADTLTAGQALAGNDFLRAIMVGEGPNPPFGGLLQMSITDVQPGRVEFVCHPDESMYNATGTVHGGILCTLLDSAASCAVLSALPSGKTIISIEIKVSYLRAVRAVGGVVRATGTLHKLGGRVGFAEAVATDENGRDIATATTSVMVLDVPAS